MQSVANKPRENNPIKGGVKQQRACLAEHANAILLCNFLCVAQSLEIRALLLAAPDLNTQKSK